MQRQRTIPRCRFGGPGPSQSESQSSHARRSLAHPRGPRLQLQPSPVERESSMVSSACPFLIDSLAAPSSVSASRPDPWDSADGAIALRLLARLLTHRGLPSEGPPCSSAATYGRSDWDDSCADDVTIPNKHACQDAVAGQTQLIKLVSPYPYASSYHHSRLHRCE